MLTVSSRTAPNVMQRKADMTTEVANSVKAPDELDRYVTALMGRFTHGVSPYSIALAYTDWLLHLSGSPGKWMHLLEKAIEKDQRWLSYASSAWMGKPCEPCIAPLPQDRRFGGEAWQQWPYNVIYQGFLLNQQWWHNATTGIDGVSRHHEQVVEFITRQLLDVVSPVNFIATNPEVAETTLREHGLNLLRGANNLLEDIERDLRDEPPPSAAAFRPGIEVAATPGRVVFRNRLIELIQYSPATDKVYAEPMLIVPAWIMKYYILDLSPHNSLVRYLVGRGHTVFMISWHNPSAVDRDTGMDDYVQLGILAAIEAIRIQVPGQHINAVGYCLGGTLLSIAAALLSCQDKDIINSMTLLAAQTDFSEAGELLLYIDESQVDYLEDLMWYQGYLDNRQMAGAFRLLRSNDLVWSAGVKQYLLGQREPMNDLMAWNADSTRMPYRMHSDYLRRLFLDNDLFSGRYRVNGTPIALTDIHMPIYAVATKTDHVSPWRSVHKIHLISGSDIRFVLTKGGHNAGIVSEPGHHGRYYYAGVRRKGDCYRDPDHWLRMAEQHDGSWWLDWAHWLDRVSTAGAAPPVPGISYGPAPGRYVLER
jgi:polyhydroxyalkanoate synthase